MTTLPALNETRWHSSGMASRSQRAERGRIDEMRSRSSCAVEDKMQTSGCMELGSDKDKKETWTLGGPNFARGCCMRESERDRETGGNFNRCAGFKRFPFSFS